MDLAEMLAEEGYDVVGQAGDGETAVALAEELRPDLVVLDVKMPKLDGISAAQRIAEQRIAPVVILTAFSQRDLVERARDAGAMAYLVKPFTKNDLVPAIEMAVSRFAELQHARGGGRRPHRAARDPQGSSTGPRASCSSSSTLSEPDAFRWIQKTAMDLRLSMRQVAEGVIAHGPGMAGPARPANAPDLDQACDLSTVSRMRYPPGHEMATTGHQLSRGPRHPGVLALGSLRKNGRARPCEA